MHQLEQFGAGLLLGGIDVLVALHDVDVDRQLAGMRGERLIARGDLRIALRAEVPDGGGIFDQEREVVLDRAAAARARRRRRSDRACGCRSDRPRG